LLTAKITVIRVEGVTMLASSRFILAILLAFVPVQAFSEPTEEVGAVFEKWKAAYDANDNVAVAKLYAEDATLHGTRSRILTVGRDAITNYFKIVVGTGNKVQFVEQNLKVINPTTVLAAGFNDFLRNKDGTLTPEPARFTMLLVKQGDDWLIAHHHSSLRPAPPQ
jgi:uncharacterized protein (TIGR02246 family)